MSGLKCSDYGNYFHTSCAKLTNTIQFINEDTIKCCNSEACVSKSDDSLPSDTSVDQAFLDALVDLFDTDNKVDLRVFKYVLKQKDDLIDELRERNRTLTKHIDSLMLNGAKIALSVDNNSRIGQGNCTAISHEKTKISKTKSSEGPSNFMDTYKFQNKNITKASNGNSVISTLRPKVKQHSPSESIGLDQEAETNSSEWVEVVKRRKQKPVLCGTSAVGNINVISKKPITKAVFVSRLASEVTVVKMTDNFVNQNLKFVKITKLKTKFDTYSSFHIEIEEEQFEEFFNADFFPEGSFISPFYGKLMSEQVNELDENLPTP